MVAQHGEREEWSPLRRLIQLQRDVIDLRANGWQLRDENKEQIEQNEALSEELQQVKLAMAKAKLERHVMALQSLRAADSTDELRDRVEMLIQWVKEKHVNQQ